MSTWKSTPSSERGRLAHNKLKIAEGELAKRKRLQQIAVTSLKVDNDADGDCDPYNRTGQFCVIEEE